MHRSQALAEVGKLPKPERGASLTARACAAAWKSPGKGSTTTYIGYSNGTVLEWDWRMPSKPTATLFCNNPARTPSIPAQHVAVTSITPVHNGSVVVGSNTALRVYAPLGASMEVDASGGAAVAASGGGAARAKSSDSGLGGVGVDVGSAGAGAAEAAGSSGSSSTFKGKSAGKRPAYRRFDALHDTEESGAVLSDAEGRFLIAACASRGSIKVEGTRCIGFDLTEVVGLTYPDTKDTEAVEEQVEMVEMEGQDRDIAGDLDVGDEGLKFDDSQLSLDLMGDDANGILAMPSPTGSDSNWNDFPNLDNLIDEAVNGGDQMMSSGHDEFVGAGRSDLSPDTDILDFVGLG